MILDLPNSKVTEIVAENVGTLCGTYEKPRIAVGLDYLEVMGMENVFAFCQQRSDLKSGKKRLWMLMGKRTHDMQCVTRDMKLWKYGKQISTNRMSSSSDSYSWESYSITLKETKTKLSLKDFNPKNPKYILKNTKLFDKPENYILYEVTVPDELMNESVNPTPRKKNDPPDLTRWFVEIITQAPTGHGEKFKDKFSADSLFVAVDVSWGNYFTKDESVPLALSEDDPVFADEQQIDFGEGLSINRRQGEFGEVPEWKWLGQVWQDKYGSESSQKTKTESKS
jgi:hypothetical protein